MSARFVELGSVAEFINGVAFRPEDWGNSGKRIIRIQNLTDSSKPFNRTDRVVDERFHVREGDLLVSWSASLGVFEWVGPDVGLLNQHIFRVLPNTSTVEKRYLRHALEMALLDMQRHLHGATMQHVNRSEFLSTRLFLPPLPEQRRIAEVLDRADALRAKRRAALAKLDSLTQAIFLDMFDSSSANAMWPVMSLGELMTDGPKNGIYKPAKDYGEGAPILRIDAFYDGYITGLSKLKRLRVTDSELDAYRLQENDFVINRVNSPEYLGKSALIPALSEPTVFESNMMRFRVDHNIVDPQFLIEFLQSRCVKDQIRQCSKDAVNQSSINQQDVRSFNVVIPPLHLQRKFACCAAAVERLKAAQRASLAKLDELFASLQHRAFRGELFEDQNHDEPLQLSIPGL